MIELAPVMIKQGYENWKGKEIKWIDEEAALMDVLYACVQARSQLGMGDAVGGFPPFARLFLRFIFYLSNTYT